MSLDEKLFGFLYRATQRMLGRGNTQVDPASVAFVDCAPELRLIAHAVAERPLSLRACADEGAVRGSVCMLPERIRIASEPEKNLQCYLARVVCDAASVRLGFALQAPAASAAERVLATLLALPAVYAHLDSELPGARGLVDEVCAMELALRSGRSAQFSNNHALDALLRLRLGQAADLPLTAAERAWLERATHWPVLDAKSLCAAVETLAPAVRLAQLSALHVWGGIDAALPIEHTPAEHQPSEATPRTNRAKHNVRARPNVRRVQHRQAPGEENPLVHSFEKVHTADEYKAGSKRVDPSDELEQHAAALDELQIGELTITSQTSDALVQADFEVDGEAAPPDAPASTNEPERFVYDEWDERARRYRAGWCSVYAVPPVSTVSPVEARTYVKAVLFAQRRSVTQLRAELARVRNARALRNRQPQGPDIDIDALIERYGAVQSGNTGPDKLFVSRRRRARDFATMLLLDTSLSTDSWIAGRRVLDVAKGALIVLGHVLGSEEVPTSIATFSSQTRQNCRFSTLKSFEEPWQLAEQRIVSAEPSGYTRIGPALRHATHLLSQHHAPKRLLVLISDAKPTDYDRYEGRYGNSDVRKAIAEAELQQVSVFTLALDARAAAHLPTMFVRGRYQVLQHPDDLARALTGLYAELLR